METNPERTASMEASASALSDGGAGDAQSMAASFEEAAASTDLAGAEALVMAEVRGNDVV
jgi:hypothetical protein